MDNVEKLADLLIGKTGLCAGSSETLIHVGNAQNIAYLSYKALICDPIVPNSTHNFKDWK